MKDWGFLLEPDADGHPVSARVDPGPLRDALLELRPRGLEIRFLRGARMETLDGLFAEFAAALQFPPYASATFDGLDECLNDLEWLPEGPLALVLLDSDRVLVQAQRAARETLFRILQEASLAWKDGRNGPPRALRVVLQSAAAKAG